MQAFSTAGCAHVPSRASFPPPLFHQPRCRRLATSAVSILVFVASLAAVLLGFPRGARGETVRSGVLEGFDIAVDEIFAE
jgi:hypothetical protein